MHASASSQAQGEYGLSDGVDQPLDTGASGAKYTVPCNLQPADLIIVSSVGVMSTVKPSV